MADKEKPEAAPVVEETVYSKADLMAGARNAFGVQPEVVAGALHLAGKTEATRSEAEAMIKDFLGRKV